MTYPRKYATATAAGDHLKDLDWDAMVDRVNGTTLVGVRAASYDYLIRNVGGVYDVIDANANLAFGGDSDEGGVDGASAKAVLTAAVASGDKKIVLAPGTFTFTSGVTVLEGTELEGCGLNTVLKPSSAGDFALLTLESGAAWATPKSGFTIKNMVLRGDNPTANQHGLVSDKAVNIRYENLIADGFYDNIQINDTGDTSGSPVAVRLTNIDSVNAVNAALNGDGASFGKCNWVLASQCFFQYSKYGLLLHNTAGWKVNSSVAFRNTDYGLFSTTEFGNWYEQLDIDTSGITNFYFNGGSLSRLNSCWSGATDYDALGTGESGIVVYQAARMAILNSTIFTAKKHGIEFIETTQNKVSGNYILNNSQVAANTYAGIKLHDSVDNMISENFDYEANTGAPTQTWAVIEDGTSDINTYKNNHFYLYGGLVFVGTSNNYDLAVSSHVLDLSGAAVDVPVYTVVNPSKIVGVRISYTEASSADAGVNIHVGVPGNVTAILSVDSEISKAQGYYKHYLNTTLSAQQLGANLTIIAGTNGGKVGVGEVTVTLLFVNSAYDA
jgi:hypothetical protein